MNVKQIYKSFNKSVCKNTSGTRGMCQRMKAVTIVAMNNHKKPNEKTTTKSTENSMSVCCCKRVCSMQINNKIGERLLNDLQQQTCTKTSALVEIDCHFYKTTESTLVFTKNHRTNPGNENHSAIVVIQTHFSFQLIDFS